MAGLPSLLKVALKRAQPAVRAVWTCLRLVLQPAVLLTIALVFTSWRMYAQLNVRCGWDNGGSWSAGLAYGPSPLELRLSPLPAIDCALVSDELVTFVADPFLLNYPKGTHNWYMFFEAKHAESWHGDIGMATSRDNGASWAYSNIVLNENFHLSYPFTISDVTVQGTPSANLADQYFMPESGAIQEIRLYGPDLQLDPARHPAGVYSSDTPKPMTQWVHVHTLMSGKPFLDSSLIWHDDRWWLWTAVNKELLLYYSEPGPTAAPGSHPNSLLSVTWHLHPKSPLRDSSCSWWRPGGRPIVYRDHVYLMAQDDTVTYGGSVRILRVTELNTTSYKEKSVRSIVPADLVAGRFPFDKAGILDDDDYDDDDEQHAGTADVNKGNVATIGRIPIPSLDQYNYITEAGVKPFGWASKRLHHIDAQEVSPGVWIASVDGDSQVNKVLMFKAIAIGLLVVVCAICYHYSLFARIPAARQVRLAMLETRQRVSNLSTTVKVIFGLVAFALLVRFLVAGRMDTRVIVSRPDSRFAHGYNPDAGVLFDGVEKDLAPSNGKVIKMAANLDECQITMITSMYDVGRGEFSGETRGFATYLEYFKQILELDTCMVVHVDPSVVDFVRKHRAARASRTVIIAEEWQDLLSRYPYRTKMQAIIDDKEFMSRVKRPGRPEMKLVGYNIIMFKKVDWVYDAARSDYFRSRQFFWMDGGYGHGKMMGFLKDRVWPDPSKVEALVNDQQTYILRVKDFTREMCQSEREMFTRHAKTVAGGFFGGSRRAIRALYPVFHQAIQRSLTGGYMDDDQAVFFAAWCDQPDLFTFEECPRNFLCTGLTIKPCWDMWNCPVYYFAPDD
ncbi:hypothetical protein CAOG_04773 [Capsaspora owczarzaki ATCC 30864]|uniref:hypothetical protein n=1 Tax=Capsaspora owczarzaki (strain ATCC 30864) TaxID=595528 RepID=UPI0001FE26F3|nr:hypothetical protein CAOG_04773 [Capsaspora owczarzaki ATCC 30864]|eukprot:XP_004347524.1 hypothetical protein CAOG_04773 [Capsaspora owczarzaki ATCC 30864]